MRRKPTATGARANEPAGTYAFNTPIGRCLLEWGPQGIRRVSLAGPTARGMSRAAVPASVRKAADRLTSHLAGYPDTLRNVAVDLSAATAFTRKVYEALRRVPPGQIVTYGELARRVGRPGASRAVGRAMATNPVPLIIPCHRVVQSTGALGGFGMGGPSVKARLLRIEGVQVEGGRARW
jgi:methylated-DNA-[protein]-cysteine S-methyltransferase